MRWQELLQNLILDRLNVYFHIQGICLCQYHQLTLAQTRVQFSKTHIGIHSALLAVFHRMVVSMEF